MPDRYQPLYHWRRSKLDQNDETTNIAVGGNQNYTPPFRYKHDGDFTVVWLVGVSLGLIAPWVLRRSALRHTFAINGTAAGLLLWGMISVFTVPTATILAIAFREIFGG